MNVKFSKGPGAISKHNNEDIEKKCGSYQKTYIIMVFVFLSDSFLIKMILVNIN